jgi:membrane protease YdiL (CAAX protease family)
MNENENFLLPSFPEQPQVAAVPQTLVERYGISPVLFGFIVLGVIFFLYQIVGGIVTVVLFGIKPNPQNVNGFRIATGISQILFIFLPALLSTRFITLTPSNFLRLRLPKPHLLVYPFFGMLSLQQLLQLYLFVQEKIPLPDGVQKIVQQFKELFEEAYKLLVSSASIPELLFVIFVIAVVPAFAEEFLFRGVIQRSFERGISPRWAMVLSGLIFGLYHLNPLTFLPLAVLGIYLGFLAQRAESLWVPVAAHFYNNAIAATALYFHLDDEALLTGNPEGMSFEMLAGTFFVSLLVFVCSTMFFVRETREMHSAVFTNDILTGETAAREEQE